MMNEEQKILENGRALDFLMASPGWKLVKGFMDSYEKQCADNLINLLSEDTSVIRAAHSAAAATKRYNRLVNEFIQRSIGEMRAIIQEREEIR